MTSAPATGRYAPPWRGRDSRRQALAKPLVSVSPVVLFWYVSQRKMADVARVGLDERVNVFVATLARATDHRFRAEGQIGLLVPGIFQLDDIRTAGGRIGPPVGARRRR